MKRILIILLLALFIGGCSTTGSMIKKIHDNPEKYLGEEVTLDGQINNRFMKSGEWYFSLVDEQSYVLVQSKYAVNKNENVSVTGIVSSDEKIGPYLKSKKIILLDK